MPRWHTTCSSGATSERGHAKPAGHGTQVPFPASAKKPTAHRCMSEPSADGHARPAGHGVHAACAPALYVPATQATRRAGCAGSAQANPGAHAVQLVAPAAAVVPDGHGVCAPPAATVDGQ